MIYHIEKSSGISHFFQFLFQFYLFFNPFVQLLLISGVQPKLLTVIMILRRLLSTAMGGDDQPTGQAEEPREYVSEKCGDRQISHVPQLSLNCHTFLVIPMQILLSKMQLHPSPAAAPFQSVCWPSSNLPQQQPQQGDCSRNASATDQFQTPYCTPAVAETAGIYWPK